MNSSISTLVKSTPSEVLCANECNIKYIIGTKVYKERTVIFKKDQIITGHYGKIRAFCYAGYHHSYSRHTLFMTNTIAISFGVAASSIISFFSTPASALTIVAVPITAALVKSICCKRNNYNINLSTFHIISTSPMYYYPNPLEKHIVIERKCYSFLNVLNDLDLANELQAYTDKVLIIELYEDLKHFSHGNEFFPSMEMYEVNEAFEQYRHRHNNLVLKVSLKNEEIEHKRTRMSIFSNSSGIGSMNGEPGIFRRSSMPACLRTCT